MNLKLKKSKFSGQSIALPFSKSISNRILIMQALAEYNFVVENLSNADDTAVLIEALDSNSDLIDIGMAGTAFRFLTAYLAIKNQEVTITGHSRMLKRPIGDLISCLNELGASISFLNEENYPPLRIEKGNLKGGVISLQVNKSSQYLTALLLIAPYLKGGLTINFSNDLVSKPYVRMTCDLMAQLGVKSEWNEKGISVSEQKYWTDKPVQVESDWSAAAFFYQYFACSDLEELSIEGLHERSIQGDSFIATAFESLGVYTTYNRNGIWLSKSEITIDSIEIDLTDTPDIIPSFAIAASLLLKNVKIKGIQTLRIKECNRVEALQIELAKIGIEVIDVNNKEISLHKISAIPKTILFSVYNDHRMAMAFASLASVLDEIEIENSEVVSKSFPNFWNEIRKLGLIIN